MGLKNRAIAIGLGLAWALSPAALADNVHWTGGGDQVSWSDPDNWDKGGGQLPDAGDRVIISGDVDTVVDQDFTIDSIQIGSLATVTIQDSTLTLENDDHIVHTCPPLSPSCSLRDDHKIDGVLELCSGEHPCGTLAVTTRAQHSFNGSGSIIGNSTSATISIASGVTMNNNLGTGVVGSMTVEGDGTFNNLAIVDAGSLMIFQTGAIDDASGAAWYTGCKSTMQFDVGSTALEGDFSEDPPSNPGSGVFVFNADVKTCGAYERGCGSITLGNNITFKYATYVNVSGGTCTNPGIGQTDPGSCTDPWIVSTNVTGSNCF